MEWDIPEQGVLAYDVKRDLAHVLRENAWEFVIPDFSDEFFILSPIKNGMALIGRAIRSYAGGCRELRNDRRRNQTSPF